MIDGRLKFETELSDKISETAHRIRSRELDWGRLPYSLGMLHAVWQAKLCGHRRITVAELGVASGNGLRSMCNAAAWYRDNYDIDIKVVGFDSGRGLAGPQGYRDHPEMWDQGYFCGEEEEIRSWLPSSAELIIGDVRDTMPGYARDFDSSAPLAYVSIDVDYYTSTVSSFPLFEMAPENYLPAMPLHVDDAHTIITYSPWTGESLALQEFNDTHEMRKFQHKEPIWRIENFYVFHVLDHPFRSGEIKPPYHINCSPI